MNEPIDQNRAKGEGLEGLEDELNVVSRWYFSESTGEPPAAIDAAILAAAHRAVNARPTSTEATGNRLASVAPRPRSIMFGRKARFALAASIVIAVSVGYLGLSERPDYVREPVIPPSAAVVDASPPAVSAPSPDSNTVSRALPSAPAKSSAFSSAGRPRKEAPQAPPQAPPQAHAAPQSTVAEKPITQQNASVPAPSDGIAAPPATPFEKMTVTGSSVRRSDTETPSPGQVITPPTAPTVAAGSGVLSSSAGPVAVSPDLAKSELSPPPAKSRPAPMVAFNPALPAPAAPASAAPAPAVRAPAAPAPALPAPAAPAPLAKAPAAPAGAPANPAVESTFENSRSKLTEADGSTASLSKRDILVAELKKAIDNKEANAAREKLAALRARYPDFVLTTELVEKLRQLGIDADPLPR
jgi:hypothetical protein